MGNTSTKEYRSPGHGRPHAGRSGSSQQSPTSPEFAPDGPQIIYTSRHGRGSRSEISTLFGMSGGGHDREQGHVETRRETKAEREARRLERERKNREIERERSMREESVDGGYLVTQGVYTGIEDYSKQVVRQLMIERRIAPFWRGLNDHSDSWTEHQLVAAAKGLPIPAADEVPESPNENSLTNGATKEDEEQKSTHLAVPIPNSRARHHPDNAQSVSSTPTNSSLPASSSPSTGSALLRGRAKTLASLTTSSRNVSQSDLQPREINLPHDPYINGQRIEACLYKDASECPICFLYYPPYLNRTRCCDQPICSECFVQIKRPDPHPPEHADPSQPPKPEETAQDPEGTLVSEPAACPYCVQPEFGVTFDPLPFKRGLSYVNQGISSGAADRSSPPMSSSSSLASTHQTGQLSPSPRPGRKRGTSLSAMAPQVITTDRVRPDWASKLAAARAHAARRSAAATALHTAAYLMNNRAGPSDQNFSRFGRRTLLRRVGSDSPSNGNNEAQLQMLNMMSERFNTQGRGDADNQRSSGEEGDGSSQGHMGSRIGSRRNRVEDLEEMMMMEAIRLSLAAEEERRKKEEKEAKKEAKRKEKEDKKAEKAAKKGGPAVSGSTDHLGPASTRIDPFAANTLDKGKTVTREGGEGSQSESAQQHLERSRAQILPSHSAAASVGSGGADSQPQTPFSSSLRPSHLRTLSGASSSASSFVDAPSGTHSPALGSSPNASGTNIVVPKILKDEDADGDSGTVTPSGTEPLFNFRSLTAMVEKEGDASPMLELGPVDGGLDNDDGKRGKGKEEYKEESKDRDHRDLGKAHEISIERADERREQGSV